MARKLRLLVPSVGRKVALVRLLQDFFDVFATDRNPLAAGLLAVPASRRVPDGGGNLVDWVRWACKSHKIDAVLPVRNDDVPALGRLPKIPGTGIVCSPPDTADICLDKLSLYMALPGLVPGTTLTPRAFPCFAKPRFGSGSRRSGPVRDEQEYALLVKAGLGEMVYQPLFGSVLERTVDMFFQNGKLIQAVVRRRTAVENGQMSRGVVEKTDKPLQGALGKLTKRLKFHGPVNAQFLVTGEGPKLIDINPRFSGGYPLTHAAGADFVALLHGLVTGRRLPAKQRPVRLGTRATSFVDYVFGEGEVQDAV